MDIELPLNSMTLAEKFQLLELIWEDICQHPGEFPVPNWHQTVLSEREQQLATGASNLVPWSEAKERLLKLG